MSAIRGFEKNCERICKQGGFAIAGRSGPVFGYIRRSGVSCHHYAGKCTVRATSISAPRQSIINQETNKIHLATHMHGCYETTTTMTPVRSKPYG